MNYIMKKAIIFYLMLGFVLFYSCKLDNYDPPTMTIEGKVVDEVTGENLYTQQPNGIKVRLLEDGFKNPTPYDFWAMSDGTFKVTKVFASKYQALVLEGPFEDASVKQVPVDVTSNNQKIEFKVVPYVRLKNVSITVSGTTVKANYNIERTTSTKVPKSSVLLIHQSVLLHPRWGHRRTDVLQRRPQPSGDRPRERNLLAVERRWPRARNPAVYRV